MPIGSLISNPLLHDILATVITLALSLAWLRAMDFAAHRGLIGQRLSRKVIHIGTGPLFVLCWLLFSSHLQARFLAALVPLGITAQFFLVGIGVMQDPAAVQAMTRTGNAREILRGPLYYGVIFVICTLLFWRVAPTGILALMLMCGGDGLAEVIGRKWGAAKLPFNNHKTWLGSAAMLLGGFSFAYLFLWLFAALGQFSPPLVMEGLWWRLGLIAFAAAIVEALPLQDVDNITTTATAAILGLALL
jgi:phytol kinase